MNHGMTDFLLAVLCNIFDLQNSFFYAKERKGVEELLCYVSARQASEISVVTIRERERVIIIFAWSKKHEFKKPAFMSFPMSCTLDLFHSHIHT